MSTLPYYSLVSATYRAYFSEHNQLRLPVYNGQLDFSCYLTQACNFVLALDEDFNVFLLSNVDKFYEESSPYLFCFAHILNEWRNQPLPANGGEIHKLIRGLRSRVDLSSAAFLAQYSSFNDQGCNLTPGDVSSRIGGSVLLTVECILFNMMSELKGLGVCSDNAECLCIFHSHRYGFQIAVKCGTCSQALLQSTGVSKIYQHHHHHHRHHHTPAYPPNTTTASIFFHHHQSLHHLVLHPPKKKTGI